MNPLSLAAHAISTALEQPGDPEEPPIARLPDEVFATNIFPYLGSQELSHAGQVCRRFNIVQRTVWQRRAQELFQACRGWFSSFGITPLGPKSLPEETAAFLDRTVQRVKEIQNSLPEDLLSQFSARDLVCRVDPKYMLEFFQKAYDHSLTTMFGALAHVPESASLEESVRLIKDWLQTAGAGGIRELHCENHELFCLPGEIGQLKALQWLDLGGNQLTALPGEIGQLTELQQLDLSGNRLKTLPGEIGRLRALQELFLGSNQLKTIPGEIGQLRALQQLDLGGNRLTSLPPEIGQMEALQELFLGSNRLASLPSEIGRLTALHMLYLDGNRLTSLPPEIGQMGALQGLDLGGNRLKTLPREIGQLTTLQGLGLAGNQLASLPGEIGQLTALQRLDLDGEGFSVVEGPVVPRLF